MLWRRFDGRESNCVKILNEQDLLVGRVGYSGVGGWCHVRKGGRPEAWILLVLIWWSHADINFSYWFHVDMVRWISHIHVWTRKSELPLGNFLRSLTQPEITRQRPFKLTDIKFDWIKCEISSIERVYYNNVIGKNVMNVDDIEDFAIF